MLTRLEHRLEFLTGGGRDLPARQQTLRNAIAWSYDLLDENEQKLFRRLSVFAGGCTVDAVEAVAEDHPAPGSVLDRLESLLDKSLLQEVEGTNSELRFRMLETLREFGRSNWKPAVSRPRSGAGMPTFSFRSPSKLKQDWRVQGRSSGSTGWSKSTTTCARRWSGARQPMAQPKLVCDWPARSGYFGKHAVIIARGVSCWPQYF